jgi:D-3-phosphoglycerate dehydrogenase
MSLRILVTAPQLEAPGRELLEGAGCLLDYVSPAGDRAAMEGKLAATRFDGILSRSIPISAAAMASCPSLRVISRAAAGYDIVDMAAANERGILVLSAAGANAQSVAEFTIGLMLAAARDIPRHHAATAAGGWERAPLGVELHGKRLALLGYGRIAQRVARIAAAIGMQVSAFSPRMREAGDSGQVRRADGLRDLLAGAEILSLHAPLTAATRGVVGAEQLGWLAPGAILVNTSRGGLVDEAAVVAALGSGRLRAAALDVRPVEPPPNDRSLGSLPNLILTPHMGGATEAARAATALAAATHLLDALLGRPLPPEALVNPQAVAGTRR